MTSIRLIMPTCHLSAVFIHVPKSPPPRIRNSGLATLPIVKSRIIKIVSIVQDSVV